MVRPYNISQNLVATPSVYVTADQKRFFAAKKRLYDRFKGFPNVLTQIINPWSYDSDWVLELREVTRDAEELAKQTKPNVPVPPATPVPIDPPWDEDEQDWKEIFYEDPTIERHFLRTGSLLDLVDEDLLEGLVDDGELAEIVLRLDPQLEQEDFKDTFDAAKDFNEGLKKEGGHHWPGPPSYNPHLIATSVNPIVYLNWTDKQLHIRMFNNPGPFAAVGAILLAVPPTVMATGLTMQAMTWALKKMGKEPPAGWETTSEWLLVFAGMWYAGRFIRSIGIPFVSKSWFYTALFSLGSGYAIWAFINQDDKVYRMYKLVKKCYDRENGNVINCVVKSTGSAIVAVVKKDIEAGVDEIIEVIKELGKDATKAFTPFLIAGVAGIALFLFAKRKVGL